MLPLPSASPQTCAAPARQRDHGDAAEPPTDAFLRDP
jgi:hypothetical protein